MASPGTHPEIRPLPTKDERLNWTSWLTCSGRFKHIVATRRLQAERRTWSVRRPKTGVLPTVLCNQDKLLNLTHSTQHTTFCHAGQQWHKHTRLSHRTATTTRFSPVGIGCQKQMVPRFCQHPIRWAFTSLAFTRWHNLSTHPINRPATHLLIPEGWKAELA